MSFFFFNDTATTEIYTLSLHDALPIFPRHGLALLRDLGTVEALERDALRRDHGHLAVLEERDETCVLHERGGVGRDEVLVLAIADDHAAGVADASGHDLRRILRGDEDEGRRPFQARKD